MVAEKNKYVKEIHFLHSFPDLFPIVPNLQGKRVRNTTHNNVQYTHSEKKPLIYLLYNGFILIYLFLHHTITTASTEKKRNLQTLIHTTMQSLTFSQAKFYKYANVHCNRRMFINVRNATLFRLNTPCRQKLNDFSTITVFQYYTSTSHYSTSDKHYQSTNNRIAYRY